MIYSAVKIKRTFEVGPFLDGSDEIGRNLGAEVGLLERGGGDAEQQLGLSNEFVLLEVARSQMQSIGHRSHVASSSVVAQLRGKLPEYLGGRQKPFHLLPFPGNLLQSLLLQRAQGRQQLLFGRHSREIHDHCRSVYGVQSDVSDAIEIGFIIIINSTLTINSSNVIIYMQDY